VSPTRKVSHKVLEANLIKTIKERQGVEDESKVSRAVQARTDNPPGAAGDGDYRPRLGDAPARSTAYHQFGTDGRSP
jgi:hypothetical protein